MVRFRMDVLAADSAGVLNQLFRLLFWVIETAAGFLNNRIMVFCCFGFCVWYLYKSIENIRIFTYISNTQIISSDLNFLNRVLYSENIKFRFN